MRLLITVLLLLFSADAFCWVRTYGRVNDQRVSSIASTTDGMYVAVNEISGDASIMKLNFQGEVLWQKTYNLNSASSISSLSALFDGNIVAAGFKAPNDLWILKLDPDGNVLWEKTESHMNLSAATQIFPTNDSGFLVSAASYLVSNDQNIWLLKLDTNGNSLWQRNLDAEGLQDLSFGCQQTTDGGYIVSNFRNFKQGSNHSLWLVKLNSSGNKVWERIYGIDARQGGRAYQTTDGGYILSGSIFRPNKALDLWVLKLNSSGSVVWQTALGGILDEVGNVYPVFDGYIVVGYTDSFGFGETDIWVVKLDFLGTVIWQKAYGGSMDDYATSFAALNNGRYVIGGFTESYGADGEAWILSINTNGEINDQCTVSQDTTAIAYDPMETSQPFNGNLTTVNIPISDITLPTGTWTPTINTQCCSVTLNSTILPIGGINLPYETSLISDATNATFTITEGNLPDGLGLDSMTGVISGIPTTEGTSFFEITVTDVFGCSESRMYRIDVVICLFCDDFEDGILSQQWTYTNSSWLETSGILIGQVNRRSKALASPVFSGCTLCTIHTSFQMTDGIKPRLTFVGWHQDKNNRIELLVKPDQDKWILRQRHDGRIRAKSKLSSVINAGIYYNVSIQYDGNLLRLKINGVEVLTLSPVPEGKPSGTVGFDLKATNGSFESITVY